jgi:hypothetical protein
VNETAKAYDVFSTSVANSVDGVDASDIQINNYTIVTSNRRVLIDSTLSTILINYVILFQTLGTDTDATVKYLQISSSLNQQIRSGNFTKTLNRNAVKSNVASFLTSSSNSDAKIGSLIIVSFRSPRPSSYPTGRPNADNGNSGLTAGQLTGYVILAVIVFTFCVGTTYYFANQKSKTQTEVDVSELDLDTNENIYPLRRSTWNESKTRDDAEDVIEIDFDENSSFGAPLNEDSDKPAPLHLPDFTALTSPNSSPRTRVVRFQS